jgi:hypothetical protein
MFDRLPYEGIEELLFILGRHAMAKRNKKTEEAEARLADLAKRLLSMPPKRQEDMKVGTRPKGKRPSKKGKAGRSR